MIKINEKLTPLDILPKADYLFELSCQKIINIQNSWIPDMGPFVFTRQGMYNVKGGIEWTMGLQVGSAILQFEAGGEESFLHIGRDSTLENMSVYVSHCGTHNHGFSTVSTYGNLLRLMNEGAVEFNNWEKEFYEIAVNVSGAAQAARWTELNNGLGFIYSSYGPHSLFMDSIISLRTLALAYQLGHILLVDKNRPASLLERFLQHSEALAQYNISINEDDKCERVTQESIFNINDGSYSYSNSPQGSSPSSTWTRGLAWALLGFAEQAEFLNILDDDEFERIDFRNPAGKEVIIKRFLYIAEALADYYIANTPTDGIPYWDTGAPGLSKLGDYLNKPAAPFNDYEPVDSSAAVIAAQGLLRLGNILNQKGELDKGQKFFQAGLTIADTLFSEPYISDDINHQGLILHSIYHRLGGWDFIPEGQKIPCGESTIWGDYYARELALLIKKMAENKPYFKFFI